MKPSYDDDNKDRYRRCKSIDPGFQGRAANWTNFKNRRPRKNNFPSNSNYKNNNEYSAFLPDPLKTSTLEEDILQTRIRELEQIKCEAEFSIEKVKNEMEKEKIRADLAEKEIHELQSHIAQLIAIQKEKDSEFAEYKTAAEFYISKSDSEKEDTQKWAEENEKEFINLQKNYENLQREMDEKRIQAEKEEEKKIEIIKRTQVQCRRIHESLKVVEQRNEKLDLEVMKCRKILVNAEEQTSQIYQNAKKLTSKWKKIKGKSKTLKKLFKDLKKNKRNLKRLKKSLSTQLSDQSTYSVADYRNRQIYCERQTFKASHPSFSSFPLTMKHK